jgi:hypothetical protein
MRVFVALSFSEWKLLLETRPWIKPIVTEAVRPPQMPPEKQKRETFGVSH